MPLPCNQAWRLANIVLEALRPYCQRIEVAGSIRRAAPVVNDIDLVLLPKPGQRRAIEDRVRRRCHVRTSGAQTLIADWYLPPHLGLGLDIVQLDLWFAHEDEFDLLSTYPSNWGTLWICRTGSAAANIRLARRAQALGLHWQPHEGVYRGDQLIASRTEEEVYAALGLQWIPPVYREARFAWRSFLLPGADPIALDDEPTDTATTGPTLAPAAT